MTTEPLFWTALAVVAVVATAWLLVSICIVAGMADRAMEDSRREVDEFERKLKQALADEKWRATWASGISFVDEEAD